MTPADSAVGWSGRLAVVSLPAEVDVTNSESIADLFAEVAAERPEIVIADLTGTTFCDSSGVHAIARGYRLAAANGGELRIAIGSSPARRILELTGLDQVVAVYAEVEQAVAAPRAPV